MNHIHIIYDEKDAGFFELKKMEFAPLLLSNKSSRIEAFQHGFQFISFEKRYTTIKNLQ